MKSKKSKLNMGLVEGSSNPVITKFVQEQFDQLLKSAKLHELIERISFQEAITKDKALKLVLDSMAAQAEEKAKAKSGKKSAAAMLELILR